MKNIHLCIKSLLTIFIACSTALPSFSDDLDVLFILDASGSMKQITAGKTQIDSAKEAMTEVLKDFPASVPVGLRVYAHRENQADKEKSCLDTELIAPLSAGSAGRIISALNSIQPKGYTPMSYSLEQARNDFDVSRESQKTIILLSDGEETCGGDPAETVKKLLADGFKFTLHVIGFNVDAKTKAQLEAAALAGNGQYFSAKNAAELAKAMSEATKKSLVIDKEKTVYGTEIRGGDSFETAVPLEAGKEYRLDHHQKKNEYDYFLISAKAGQEINVTLKTLEKGIAIRPDGKTQEGESPYFGSKLNGPDRQQLDYKEIIGKKFGTETLKAAAGSDANYYLLVGSEYADVNKDHASFTVNLTSKGDLDSDNDAAESLEDASAIEANKRYRKNFIGGPDQTDSYSFNAKAGESYFIGFIPANGYNHYTYVKILTEFKEALSNKSFSGGQGGKTEQIQIPEDGTYYVEISLSGNEKEIQQYAFELRKAADQTSEEKKIE